MRRRAGLACLLAVALLSAGCGAGTGRPGSPGAPVPSLPLATSLVTGSGTWAVAVMGGPAASHNDFWQLFVRPATTATWRLVTPPGVASNGGLVVASPGTGPVVAGFRPSQNLSYSPLATTRDNGAVWSPAILDAGLADVPDALAAAPARGRLLALLTTGTAVVSGPGGAGWATLASRHALVGTGAWARCRPAALTAAAFSPAGAPMLAATCSRPGTTGIFAFTGDTWHPAGPTLGAAYGRQDVTVLRLTTAAGATMALLAAGSRSAAHVLAAWSADGGAHWIVSPALPLNGARPTSASFGPGGTAAVTLTGNRADTLGAPAGPWRRLPPLPPGTATLAPGSAAGWEALAVHGTKLAIWKLAPEARGWAAMQTITVPVQFGSSG